MEPRQEAASVQVRALYGLDLAGIRGVWPPRFGPAPALRSPELLRRLLAWKLQVEAFGDLDAETRRLLVKPTLDRSGLSAIGTRLVREWKGECHEVRIEEDHVVYRGRRYTSLSQAARAITGVRWNGPRFFGLRRGS